MNLTKRKLLAFLSLELFLYAIHLPIKYLYFMAKLGAVLGGGPADSAPTKAMIEILIYGPPGLLLLTKCLISLALAENARRDVKARETMGFGLKLFAVQAALVVFAHVMPVTTIAAAFMALSGIIAAALMENENGNIVATLTENERS